MADPSVATGPRPFGELLRHWRLARRMSQLTLATEAEISARHLSFLETGRTQPSRQMVLFLAGVLDVPLRDQNLLLAAAGFTAVNRETALAAPEMDQVRRALDFMLTQQEPYPALVVDRHWNLLMQNHAADRLFRLFLDPEEVAEAPGPPNAVRLTFHPRGLRPYIENWEALAGPLIQQIHREAVGGIPDEGTRRLLDEILSYPGVPARWRTRTRTRSRRRFSRWRFAKATSGCGSSRRSPPWGRRRTSPSRNCVWTASSLPTRPPKMSHAAWRAPKPSDTHAYRGRLRVDPIGREMPAATCGRAARSAS